MESLFILTKPFVEFGLVHRPWIDFEQKINRYRVQGTMFLERCSILRSADYGLTFCTLFGGEMNDEYKEKVNKNYPGRYGSLSFGIYNGGGYEAIEKNRNKLLEARLTVRPFPKFIPGFQMSWIGAYGKGNTKESPLFSFNALFLSMEKQRLVLTFQYYKGIGNLKGDAIDEWGKSFKQNGYSIFSELKLPIRRVRLFMRYDEFDNEINNSDWFKKRIIMGLSYYFLNNSKILIDYDYLQTNDIRKIKTSIFEVAVEFNY
jgi:hypothetical protein